MIMDVLNSIYPVVYNSKHVSINKHKTSAFAEKLSDETGSNWLTISPFNLDHLEEEDKINFIFALDSISFSYWGEPKWAVQYKGKKYDGAKAMIASLGRAMENGVKLNPLQLANFQRCDLENILRGNTEIPLLDHRLRILREIGNVVIQKFGGDFRNLLDKSHYDALRLVDLITETFPSFEDSSTYNHRPVYFNKRAQLLAADLSHIFHGFKNVDELTACADYKIPQVLRRHGILEYDRDLEEKIDALIEIPRDSEYEVEIRANTIYAVELLTDLTTGLNANEVNDYLWLEGQAKSKSDKPYHRTRTTAY